MLSDIAASRVPGAGQDCIGLELASLTDFQKEAASLLAQADDGTATYVPFAYKIFSSVVCSNWKSTKCPAGVAAEVLSKVDDSWVIKASHLQHNETCRYSRLGNFAAAVSGYGGLDTTALTLAKDSVKPNLDTSLIVSAASARSVPSEHGDESKNKLSLSDHVPARKLSTSSGIRVKLVHRDSSASSTLSSPLRSPVPKQRAQASSSEDSHVADPPQVDDSFTSLEAFHKTTKQWINTTFPQYAIYFRSRKGDRPEFYCKYQNSPGASTTPGLGCKFGFNAKRRIGSDGREVYVVTKSIDEHIPECLRKTGQDSKDSSQSSGTEDRKRKSSFVGQEADQAITDNNNKRTKADL